MYFFSLLRPHIISLPQKNNTIVEYTPPAEELKKWEAVGGKPLWENWVKQMEQKGHSKAREILESTLKMAQ
jgi:hypothetical protein